MQHFLLIYLSHYQQFINKETSVILPFILTIILRIFVIGIYKISSSSMEPTLLPGDYIIVNKLSFGARLIKPLKLIRQKK